MKHILTRPAIHQSPNSSKNVFSTAATRSTLNRGSRNSFCFLLCTTFKTPAILKYELPKGKDYSHLNLWSA